MNKAIANLNSSEESTKLTNGSAARFGMESQPSQVFQYNHENIYRNKNKVTVHDLFQNIVDNLLKFQSNYPFQYRITEAEQIVKEYEWTDMLIEIVEYGNTHVLSSFQYRIVMEDD